MKLTSILRTTALTLALVMTVTSSGLNNVDASRIKRMPIRIPKAPCPSSAAKAALTVTAATATLSAITPLAGTATAPVLPTSAASGAVAGVPTQVAMAAPWKQVAPTTADPATAAGTAIVPATLVPGPMVPATLTATKIPAEATTAPTTTTPTTPPTTDAPTTDTGKITVNPIGDNLVTVGFKDGASALTDGQIVTATVSLNTANRANPPPSVELVLPVGLLCARTTFVFNAKDTTTFEQQVTCRTDAGSTVASSVLGHVVDLTLGFRFPDAQPSRTPQQQIIKRTVIPAARCLIIGDPHVLTLDARQYDFMEQGVFRMFKSRSLQVQVYLENCDPKIKTKTLTCTRGVAVSFGSSVARLFVTDGRLQVAKGTASAADWLAIERLGGNTDSYRVFVNADHMTFVDVMLYPFGTNPYLDVILQVSALVRASAGEGGVSGMCGNWNGNPSDDVVKTDEVLAMHATSTSQNLFTCLNDACAALTSTTTPHDAMAKTIVDNGVLLSAELTNSNSYQGLPSATC